MHPIGNDGMAEILKQLKDIKTQNEDAKTEDKKKGEQINKLVADMSSLNLKVSSLQEQNLTLNRNVKKLKTTIKDKRKEELKELVSHMDSVEKMKVGGIILTMGLTEKIPYVGGYTSYQLNQHI